MNRRLRMSDNYQEYEMLLFEKRQHPLDVLTIGYLLNHLNRSLNNPDFL